MNRKIQEIRQLCKALGNPLNRWWKVETPTYTIVNSRLGGWKEMIISARNRITGEYHCGIHWTDDALDTIISELKAM